VAASRQCYLFDTGRDSHAAANRAPKLEPEQLGFCSSNWDEDRASSSAPNFGSRCSTAYGDRCHWDQTGLIPVPADAEVVASQADCFCPCTSPSGIADPRPRLCCDAADGDCHSWRRRNCPPLWSSWDGGAAAGSDVDAAVGGSAAAVVVVAAAAAEEAVGDAGGSVAVGGAVVGDALAGDVDALGGAASTDAADDVSDIRDVGWVP